MANFRGHYCPSLGTLTLISAMNSSHSGASEGDEEQSFRQELLHQHNNRVVRIEQKIHHTDSTELPQRTMIVRRKTRRKEDGPLALCCEWVVEHQIGRQKELSIQMLS